LGAMEDLQPSGRELNDAARHFAGNNPAAPPAMRAAPELYGELARTVLLWTRDVLAAVDEAARARPAAQPAFQYLMGRVDDYFAAPSRWPDIPSLMRPLLTLVPAYYALRAVQRLDHHVEPPLLAVDCNEAYDFMEEILGRGPAMSIRRDKNTDLEDMPRAVENLPGYDLRTFRTAFSSGQQTRLERAREAASRPPAQPTEPAAEVVAASAPSAGYQADVEAETNAILAGTWRRRLADTRITLRSESDFDTDYSGGSTFYSATTTLDLLGSGRYLLRETTISRVSSGGYQVGGDPQVSESLGEWTVESLGGNDYLRLTDVGGTLRRLRITAAGSGEINVDGQERRWTSL
jgi:hypothetical protein